MRKTNWHKKSVTSREQARSAKICEPMATEIHTGPRAAHEIMNRELKSSSLASEPFKNVLATGAHAKPALRDMPALRRILHLIWEVVWPYEIVWNSKQHEQQRVLDGESWRSEKLGIR